MHVHKFFNWIQDLLGLKGFGQLPKFTAPEFDPSLVRPWRKTVCVCLTEKSIGREERGKKKQDGGN